MILTGFHAGGNAFASNPWPKKAFRVFLSAKNQDSMDCTIIWQSVSSALSGFFPLVALAIAKMKPRLPIYGLSLLMRSIDFRFAVHQQNSRFAFFQCGAKGIVGVLTAAASHDSRHAACKSGLLEKFVESPACTRFSERSFLRPLRHIISCLPPRSSEFTPNPQFAKSVFFKPGFEFFRT